MKTWITTTLILLTCSISLAEKKGKKGQKEKEAATRELQSEEGLKESLLGEMGNLARALRSLDQSYAFRGIQGCGSCTAGSAFVDWEAKGIQAPKRMRVLPPEPLKLSEHRSHGCQTCGGGCEACQDCSRRLHGQHSNHHHADSEGHAKAAHRHHDKRCSECSKSQSALCTDCTKAMVAHAKKHHVFAINLCIETHQHHCPSFHPLVSSNSDWSRANLAVGQVGHDIRLRILTNKKDEFGSLHHEISLGKLGCGSHRIALEFDSGKLWICVDGSQTAFLNLPGNLSNWK